MDFKTFQSNLKVLDKQTGNTIRSKYINEFVNTEHEQYHQQIQLKHNHSCERILIEDYWKFDKDSVIEIDFNVLLEGEAYLPEDIYIFDKNMTWTLIKTHEDINGHCYCLKSGTI